jgi:hypothetical protein
MKIFWILVVFLACAAVAWVGTARFTQGKAAAQVAREQAKAEAARAKTQEQAARASSSTPVAPPTPPPAAQTAPEAATPTTTSTPAPTPAPSPAPQIDAPAEKLADKLDQLLPSENKAVPTEPMSVAELIEYAKPALVVLTVRDAAGTELRKAAGFLMSADQVVTSAAALEGASSVRASADSLIREAIGTVARNTDLDLAIVRLSQPFPGLALRLNTEELPNEAKVALLADSAEPDLHIGEGSVRTYRDTPAGRVLSLALSGSRGVPGSPILDPLGRVVGVVTASVGNGGAVRAADLAALPRRELIPFASASASAPVARTVPQGDVKMVRKDDGSAVVDGRFTLKGEGTRDKPYEIAWEYLVSASEEYEPRKGKKTIPPRIALLDGKFVRISGYIAFPLYVEEPKELLSMLNQWDGCCIGVPPTPYDAIEVKLRDVASKDDRLATYGTVEGKLSVKPYLVGDWLVGLYLMDDATVKTKQYGGFGS